jgi:flagellar biosynthesis protein FliQ
MNGSTAKLNEDWPQRTLVLSVLGATVGLLTYFLIDPNQRFVENIAEWRGALAAFLLTGGVALAFVMDRSRIKESVIFAALAGLLTGLTYFWSGAHSGYDDWQVWRIASAAIAVAIAAPLFQAWVSAGMPRRQPLSAVAYPAVHDRVWMNVILWFFCWAFAGLLILMGFLVGALFDLLGINFISRQMQQAYTILPLVGGAFGAAAGVLRDREQILATLQKVVRTALSLLAPALGAALIVFLLITVFSGLSTLWETTKATTPILLGVIGAALILANAVIGDSAEDEGKAKLLRWAAMALGGSILPLAVIAAISTGVRVDQYGLSPDRLWAIVFTAVACAIGVAYAVSLLRGRLDWHPLVRKSNLLLASGLCVLAFLLATPLLNFSAISTANQVSRLESGLVTPQKFSWSALRFDYGDAGRAALKTLSSSGKTPEIKQLATTALVTKEGDRYNLDDDQRVAERKSTIAEKLVIMPNKVSLPAGLSVALSRAYACESEVRCILYYEPGSTEAFLVSQSCAECNWNSRRLTSTRADWSDQDQVDAGSAVAEAAGEVVVSKPFSAGKVEIRNVTMRRVFVDGESVGDAFDPENGSAK